MANTSVRQDHGPTARRVEEQAVRGIVAQPEGLEDGAVGVLSQTIIPSTTVRWILPARIRHQDHNDVVFVGESSVQLREFLPNRHLANIPARLDFGCRILAANVVSYVDPTPFVDQVVKQEEREEDVSHSAQPPDILVLALDFCEIAFVYAENLAPKYVKFRVARKKLPADVSSLAKYGRHLAAESKSCTVAVAPANGQFALLRLKDFRQLVAEVAAFDACRPELFKPFREERFYQVDGLILKMEFLSSPPSERTKMVLALLISRNEATYLHIYSWEKGAPLTHTKRESCSPRKLRNLDRMPLLMIPANDNTSFTLVTESGLTLYDNVLSPTMQLAHIETPQNFPPTFMGSCRNPLWVQWAKPCRHSEYLKTNDDFFLVREDGVLQYVETKLNETSKLHSTNVVDSLNISVDTAFAVLEGPPYHGGDICISGGDMTDGAVCHLRARVSLEKYQTITNLAPIRDMLVLESNRGEDGKRLFVCSGKGEGHAAVAEIRRGLEARMNFIAEQEDCAAVTGLWFLPEIGDDKLTLIISNPLQTVAWRIDFKESKLESADNDLAVKGIQLSEQTLALAVTRENLVIQITPSAVTICSTWSKMSSFYSQHASLPVLIATINADDMLFATASMVNHEFQVLLNSIVISDAGISVDGRSEAFNLPEEPSSILILNVDGIQCLVVGTVTGTIHVLSSEPGQQLRPLGQYSIEAIFPQIEQSAVCSLAFLRDATLNAPALVCGTRNGWLFTLSIVRGQQTTYPEEGPFDAMQGQSRYPSGIIVLRPESAQHIGQTSIALVSDRDNQSAALLLCNFEAYHVSYSQDDWVNNFQVTRIWFTDVLQPELEQPAISAVASLYRHGSSSISQLEATFICIGTDGLLLSSLSLEPSLVPRRWMVAGDPHKLVFAKGIGKLVAAIDQSTLTADADPRRPARRVIRPGIQLLDLENGSSSPTHKQVLLLGQAESRITSMLSWTPTDGERYLEIIVVGLYIEGRDTAHCDGRMVYLTPFQDGQKGNELNIGISRTIRFVGSPIYSLAPYASSSLVVCAGPHLFLQTLDLSTGKWTRGPHHPLPSPAVSLHVSGRFIYATTARHSLMVFEVDRGELSLRAEEAKQREAIRGATQFVGTAEGGMLSVSSNRGGRVLGLSKQDQGDFLLLFDASFPVTVNCLRKSHDRDTATQAGNRYYGTTQDGALYQFTVLGRKEWEFLNFLARVSWKRHTEQPRVKRKLSSQQRRQRKKFQATEMHINGDHLVELLHGGPQELRRLLEEPPCPNLEERESLSPDQKLRELSRLGEPLFGKSEDILLAASRWMRKLVSDT